MAKISKTTAHALEQKGWTTQDVNRNPDGSLSFSNTRPIYQSFLEEGYWDETLDDDERILREAGDRPTSGRSKSKWKTRNKTKPVRRSQVSFEGEDGIDYGVLQRIESVSQIKLPVGWSGSVDDMAEAIGMDVEEIAQIWRKSVETLRAKDINIT